VGIFGLIQNYEKVRISILQFLLGEIKLRDELDHNYEILVVEDNNGDIRLIKEVFKDIGLKNSIKIARDGEEAMKILCREGEYLNEPIPKLILLDLNLPKKDGREVLAEIKSHDELKSVPVIVLTTSNSEEDIAYTYSNYGNAYITKPADLEQFLKVLKAIPEFWFNIVKLPR
jgi:CheY-like chemotaxis protein